MYKFGFYIFSLLLLLVFSVCGINLFSRLSPVSGAQGVDMLDIYIGQNGDEIIKGTKYYKKDPQPAGVTFFTTQWVIPSLGNVRFKHAESSFEIKNVLSVTGYLDVKEEKHGIDGFSIFFGFSDQPFDDHQSTLDRFYEFLNYLQRQGWRRFISFDGPRISGRESYEYINYNMTRLDASYKPSLDEWINLPASTAHWMFYADGVFLKINFSRSFDKNNNNAPVYLFSMNLESEEVYMNVYLTEEERENKEDWRNIWRLREKEKDSKKRAEQEIKAKALGFHIDTGYQDPVLKGLQTLSPVQPDVAPQNGGA